jgi:ribosomal protein L40E
MMPEYIEYDIVVRLDDANIEALNLRGLCRVELSVTATSEEEATKCVSKYGHVGAAYRVDEVRGLSEENKKQLVKVAFYRPSSRNEEIYTYVICNRCMAYSTHQQVWCGKCGSKLVARKGRASEFEKEGYEDGYSLVWYKKCEKDGFFEVSIKLKSNVSINLANDKVEPLGIVVCRVSLGIKTLRRHTAVEIASKYGEVYHCRYNRGDEKFFGIIL